MTDEAKAYAARWQGEPFNPMDPRDAFSEEVRIALLKTLAPFALRVNSSEDVADLASGAMLGLVMAICATSRSDADAHQQIRDNLIAGISWAVDSARLHLGLPPLEDEE